MNGRGFTMVEVMVAITIAALVSGMVYLLLDTGLDLHERGTGLGTSNVGLASAAGWFRADIARSTAVEYAGTDSLVIDLPDGRRIEWAARSISDGLAVYRSEDDGGGFSERPKRPVIELKDSEFISASLEFSSHSSGIVRGHFKTGGRNLSVEGAPWMSP